MSDRYMRFTHSTFGQMAIQGLSLPLPVPPELERADGPWQEKPLSEASVLLGTTEGTAGIIGQILSAIESTGAEIMTLAGGPGLSSLKGAASRKSVKVQEVNATEQSYRALVLDATGVEQPKDLRALYDFFHPLIRQVKANGRIVVIGRPPEEAGGPAHCAVSRALEGFTRSLAKEVGRKGITSQLVYVGKGAEPRVKTPLRFLLSSHSAFVDGQVIRVTKEVQGNPEAPYSQMLKGKVALVTGAARGIGEAIAKRLASEGARVVCLDRPGEESQLAQVAGPIGGEVLPVDITDADAPSQIASFLDERCGGVDAVVHNAGVTRDKTLVKMTESAWDMTIDINLASIMPINEKLLEGTLHQHGRIVCMASIAGIAGNPGQTNYGATKAGLIGYVNALGKQVASKGITANAVAPGFIETRMTAEIPFATREVGRRLNSLSQGGLPNDVAEAVTLFSSPGANGLNGSVLRVCGQSLLGA